MRFAALLCILSLATVGFTQDFRAALRVTNCVGFQTERFDATILCNASGFIETEGYGVFLQVTPRYGPPHENFQVRPYLNDVGFELGPVLYLEQVGFTIGRELGAWFGRLEVDWLLVVDW